MKHGLPAAPYLFTALLCAVPFAAAAQPSTPPAEIVRAANTFLSTLTADQRHKVLYAFDDAAQRAKWSNFPTGFVPRGGISLKQMTVPQRQATLHLLATVLSPMGLEKVNEIREADDDFKANGSKRGPGGRGNGPPPGTSPGPPPGAPNGPPPGSQNRPRPGGPGGRPPSLNGDMFGSDLYYISFLGTPSVKQPWMLQFGGHHLALNITIAGSKGVLTPTLTGAQPATFKLNGKTVRPVGRESDKALALLRSLDENQRKQAVLSYRVADLVLGPGQDGKKIVPDGLKASAMNPEQQAKLLDLIAEWAGILTEPYASARMAQMKADLNETWFAWSGATPSTSEATTNPSGAIPSTTEATPGTSKATRSTSEATHSTTGANRNTLTAKAGSNITAYYRIQGPHLVIEYAPQSDEPDNHVHTMYRDPTNDYGSALLNP